MGPGRFTLARTARWRRRLRPLWAAVVQSGPSATADCSGACSQGTHRRWWLGVGLWRPEPPSVGVQGVVCVLPAHQRAGSPSCQPVTLQEGRLLEVQDGNSAKPPFCKIKGSWGCQGCPVVMLQEAGCWPLPPERLKSAGSKTASLIFRRDLGGPSQMEDST